MSKTQLNNQCAWLYTGTMIAHKYNCIEIKRAKGNWQEAATAVDDGQNEAEAHAF